MNPLKSYADIGSSGGTGSTPISVTASAANFSVTIPTSLPVTVSSDGTVTASDNAKLTNNSSGPVTVSNVVVETQNSWTLVPSTTDFKTKQVNLKEFSLKINDIDVYSNADGIVETFGEIAGNSDLSFIYAATVAPQSEAVSQTIAKVVFTVEWNKATEPISPTAYLTFSSPSEFTLATYNTTANWDGTLFYSTNTTSWNEWDGSSISSESGKLYIAGENNTVISGDSGSGDSLYRRWVLTGSNISCNGDIRTLLDYSDPDNTTMGISCFNSLFSSNANLISAPSLPATELATECYAGMFMSCSGLSSAPALPATELTYGCYHAMFSGCTGLTSTPTLSATTLAGRCYAEMFNNCYNLETATSLPATTLANSCYDHMFFNCWNLTSAPALPATELVYGCYFYMFSACGGLTSTPVLPATTLATYCYNGMFKDCTGLSSLPELPATILTKECYTSMFEGCSNIKLSQTQTGIYKIAYRIPKTGTSTTAENALYRMFTSTGGTFTGTPTINKTYYLASNALEFDINGSTYSYDSDTSTWEDWLASSYNTLSLRSQHDSTGSRTNGNWAEVYDPIFTSSSNVSDGTSAVVLLVKDSDWVFPVDKSDSIVQGGEYYTGTSVCDDYQSFAYEGETWEEWRLSQERNGHNYFYDSENYAIWYEDSGHLTLVSGDGYYGYDIMDMIEIRNIHDTISNEDITYWSTDEKYHWGSVSSEVYISGYSNSVTLTVYPGMTFKDFASQGYFYDGDEYGDVKDYYNNARVMKSAEEYPQSVTMNEIVIMESSRAHYFFEAMPTGISVYYTGPTDFYEGDYFDYSYVTVYLQLDDGTQEQTYDFTVLDYMYEGYATVEVWTSARMFTDTIYFTYHNDEGGGGYGGGEGDG